MVYLVGNWPARNSTNPATHLRWNEAFVHRRTRTRPWWRAAEGFHPAARAFERGRRMLPDGRELSRTWNRAKWTLVSQMEVWMCSISKTSQTWGQVRHWFMCSSGTSNSHKLADWWFLPGVPGDVANGSSAPTLLWNDSKMGMAQKPFWNIFLSLLIILRGIFPLISTHDHPSIHVLFGYSLDLHHVGCRVVLRQDPRVLAVDRWLIRAEFYDDCFQAPGPGGPGRPRAGECQRLWISVDINFGWYYIATWMILSLVVSYDFRFGVWVSCWSLRVSLLNNHIKI